MELTRQHKRILETIRRSGIVNMYGAAPYLADAANISIKDARQLLMKWMDTYDPKDKDYVDLR